MGDVCSCCIGERGGSRRMGGAPMQLSMISSAGGNMEGRPGVPQVFISEISGYTIEVAFQRSQGRRDHQEDFMSLLTLNSKSSEQYRHDDMFGVPGKFSAHFGQESRGSQEEIFFDPDIQFMGVFDGHGGDRVSEFCSERLHEEFLKRYVTLSKEEKRNSEDLQLLLTDMFLSFDEDIKLLQPKRREIPTKGCLDSGVPMVEMISPNSAGSTATVLTMHKLSSDDAMLSVAHAGDSRLLLFSLDNQPGKAIQNVQGIEAEMKKGSFFNFNPPSLKFFGTKAPTKTINSRTSNYAGQNVLPLSKRECKKVRRILRGKFGRSVSKDIESEIFYSTLDHQPTDRGEALRVIKDGGQVINNRVNGVLAVSRALGDADQKAQRGLTAVPDTYSVKLSDLFKDRKVSRKDLRSEDDEAQIAADSKDVLIVMASDGLWMYFDNETVKGDVAELLSRGFTLQQTCQVLMEKVIIDQRGIDNTTIVIIRISKENIPAYHGRSVSVGSFGSYLDVQKLRQTKMPESAEFVSKEEETATAEPSEMKEVSVEAGDQEEEAPTTTEEGELKKSL